jgi:hypothetical protein
MRRVARCKLCASPWCERLCPSPRGKMRAKARPLPRPFLRCTNIACRPRAGKRGPVHPAHREAQYFVGVNVWPCVENRQPEADVCSRVSHRTSIAVAGVATGRSAPCRPHLPSPGPSGLKIATARNADLRSSSRSASEHFSKPLNLFGNPLGNGVTVAYRFLR